MGTPLFWKGMWSSSMVEGICASSMKILFPDSIFVDLLRSLSIATNLSYQLLVDFISFMKDVSLVPITQCVKGGGVRKMFFSEKTKGLFWSIGSSYWMFNLEVHI